MKMRLERDDFIIQSIPWEVRVIPGGDSRITDCSGMADFGNYVIFICGDMPPEEQLETLCHEVLHVLVRGREKCDLTREDDLRILSVMLADTFLRNRLSFAPDDERGW